MAYGRTQREIPRIIVQEVLGQVRLLQFLRSEHVLSKTETQRKYTSNNALNLDVLSK